MNWNYTPSTPSWLTNDRADDLRDQQYACNHDFVIRLNQRVCTTCGCRQWWPDDQNRRIP